MTDQRPNHPSADDDIVVRPATPADRQAAWSLFEIDPGSEEVDDPGDDLTDLTRVYLSEGGGSCFWVADRPETGIVGMVGIERRGEHEAIMRRLRVHPEWRHRGIGHRLVERALRFCSDRGYIKVILHAEGNHKPAIRLFEEFGFQLNRTKVVDGHEVIDFYMDLYRRPRSESDEG